MTEPDNDLDAQEAVNALRVHDADFAAFAEGAREAHPDVRNQDLLDTWARVQEEKAQATTSAQSEETESEGGQG